jgi:xanthine dehydrogenase accessory factor
MRPDALARRADELAAQGVAFVTATVVRAGRPTSAIAGDVALITLDGTIDGFVGGICAEHSVRLFAWSAMQNGEPVLLRILPDAGDGAGAEPVEEDGAVTVLNTCLSGGAIEVFLEPTLPVPRVHIVGSKPIAAALERLGPELGLDVVAARDTTPEVREGDLGVIVASHGKGELEAVQAALDMNIPYVGLVASKKRGGALVEELREAGVEDAALERLDLPAGIDIGAHTPSEVALSIMANVIAKRYGGSYHPKLEAPRDQEKAEFGTDPICGMTVPMTDDSIHIEHDGETIYFCRDACRKEYEQEHGLAKAPKAKASAGKSATPSGTPAAAPPEMAVDPICGMTVAATPDTPHLEHNGETVYFCCEGCKKKFEQEQAHAVSAS